MRRRTTSPGDVRDARGPRVRGEGIAERHVRLLTVTDCVPRRDAVLLDHRIRGTGGRLVKLVAKRRVKSLDDFAAFGDTGTGRFAKTVIRLAAIGGRIPRRNAKLLENGVRRTGGWTKELGAKCSVDLRDDRATLEIVRGMCVSQNGVRLSTVA